MSKVYTLVRFSKTGNIYYGSYDTIGQIAGNYICTPKEAYDAADDVYDKTAFWREKEKRDGCNAYTYECLVGTEPECDDVEVYVPSLRAAFPSKGSEQRKLISGWDRKASPIKEDLPYWVEEFEQCRIGARVKEQIGALKKFDERMMEVNSKPLPEPIRKQREKEAFKKKFKSARNAKRIEEFCEVFKEVWLRMPDWRFGQLVSNIVKSAEMTPQTFFYIEDDEMLEMLKEVVTTYDKYTKT